MANIFRAMGWSHASEDWVAKKAKLHQSMTDPHPGFGTIEGQIKRCLSAFKIPHYEFTSHDANVAVAALRGYLVSGHPCMLAVDGDDHWLCCMGMLGSRFSVVDSADPELNVYYDAAELLNRWKSPTDPPKFYGICVTGLKPKKKKNA